MTYLPTVTPVAGCMSTIHNNQSPFLMTSEEKRNILLTPTPILLHPPPIAQTPQLLYSMTEITDMELTSVARVTSTATLVTMDTVQFKEQPPHPQQGGCRITAQYLRELPDVEVRWAFQQVCLESTIQG